MNELPLRPASDPNPMNSWPCGHPMLPWAVVDMNSGSLGCPTCWETSEEGTSWHRDGHDVPNWWLRVGAGILVLVLLLVGLLIVLPASRTNWSDEGGIGPGVVTPRPIPWPSGGNGGPAAGSLPGLTPVQIPW